MKGKIQIRVVLNETGFSVKCIDLEWCDLGFDKRIPAIVPGGRITKESRKN